MAMTVYFIIYPPEILGVELERGAEVGSLRPNRLPAK